MTQRVESSRSHIIFAGGGTCGHLFPALAVAQHLPDARITFAGSGKPLERECLRTAGFDDYVCLTSRPLPKNPWQTWKFFSENVAGFVTARKFLRQHEVSVVVGLGGYSSAAMVRAAVALGVPTMLLEQNVVPGRATRWLAASATEVCVSYAQTLNHLKHGANGSVTGNPVRAEFIRASAKNSQPHWMRENQPEKRLLISGGSGGSQLLNQQVPRALYKVGQSLRGWCVLHQTGKGQVLSTRELYRKLGIQAEVTSFVKDMAGAITSADLVVCRAGGTTLAELAVSGTPAVLIPWADAADDHQTANARHYASAGAAVLVPETQGNERLDDRLARQLQKLVTCDASRQALSNRLLRMSHPDAATHVARAISRLARRQALLVAA